MTEDLHNLFNFSVKDEILDLVPVVEMWGNCFVTLSDISGTVPHQSKPEETNVGILAGAAWKDGWVAFPEMSRRKSDLGGYGYCDLWIKRERPGSPGYYVECKGSMVESDKDMQKVMDRAVRDSQRLETEDKDGIKIAVAFGNVQFQNVKEIGAVADRINTLTSSIKEKISFDIYAHCFPRSVRNYHDNGYWYPGVVMLGKLVG